MENNLKTLNKISLLGSTQVDNWRITVCVCIIASVVSDCL